MFNKLKAKLRLTTHIWGSKHYLRNIRALSRDIHNEREKQEDSKNKMESISGRRFGNVSSHCYAFFDSAEKEHEYLNKIADLAMTVQKRLLDELREMDRKLKSLLSNQQLSSEAQTISKGMQVLVHEVRKKVILEKKQLRDLRKDRERLRSMSAKGGDWLEHGIRKAAKIGGKDERSENKDRRHIFHMLTKLNSSLPDKYSEKKASKMREKQLKKMKEALEDFKESMEQEMDALATIFKAHIVLSHRLRDRMADNLKYMQKSGKIPKFVVKSLNKRYSHIISEMNEDEKKIYYETKYEQRAA